MPAKKQPLIRAKVEKLIHGGQGLATTEDGKKALVWGVLPNEQIVFKVTKKRRDYLEGIVEEVILASEKRITPKDSNYLSTSPWQILAEDKEDQTKPEILKETFQRAGVEFDFEKTSHSKTTDFYHYRNKMEYSFYGDEDGVHLALYNRGTHFKQVVECSSIAKPEIDEAAKGVLSEINRLGI